MRNAFARLPKWLDKGKTIEIIKRGKHVADLVPKAGGKRKARKDGDYAISWIKREGEGRVFYCSLGHDMNVFQEPAILQFYLDGIQYALGDLAADATPKP